MASAALAGSEGAPPTSIGADTPLLAVASPRLLMVGTMTASLMQVLDTTIANVAIPHMQSSLGATPDTVSWVLTSYIIASAIAMPITGWLADRVGSRRLFLLSVTGFVIASILCGMAQNLEEMVVFRALQGVAGAFIGPLSQSSLLDTTRPSRQPQMVAIWGMGVMVGPILGPVLGGWLTENWNWRWVFLVNLPVGLLCLSILVPQLPSRPIARRRFDLFGFGLVAVGLSALQLLLDRGAQIDWFESVEAWIYLGLFLSAAWIAIVHFATAKSPLFDRAIFHNANLTIALLFMLVVGAIMYATMALLPPMMQHLFSYSVIGTGVLLVPRGVGSMMSMQMSSQLMRRGVDPRWIVAGGFLICAWSLHDMAGWSLDVDRNHILFAGVVQGIGMGLVFIPLQATAFATLATHLRTDGSSLLSLFRSVGASFGIAVVTAMSARSLQTNHEELAGRVSPALTGSVDVSSLDRFQQYGEAGLRAIDAEVARQAAMIAYSNDFYAMMWVSLAAIPLVLLIRISADPASSIPLEGASH